MFRKFIRLSFLLSVLLLAFSAVTMAASGDDEDKTSFIMHHIKDSHEWHFATLGHTHITLPLPVIVYSGDRGFEFSPPLLLWIRRPTILAWNTRGIISMITTSSRQLMKAGVSSI